MEGTVLANLQFRVPRAQRGISHSLEKPGSLVLEEVTLGVAQDIYRAIRKTELRCEGANLFLSDGAVAGQEVPHSHLHIAPRFTGDGHRMGFSHTDAEAGARDALDAVAAQIRAQPR